MKSVAIITARGGSKRIPRKNIKAFCGKPIIAYSIEVAIQSECFDEIMVSTDDKEIADIANAFGAKVPFYRSEETSNDHAMTADAVFEVLDTYRTGGREFDYACCIYPTAPMISVEKLREGYETLKKYNVDSVVPVTRFSFPIQRALKIEDNKLRMIYPENMHVRSQDLMPTYHDVGQFYWLRVGTFFSEKKLFTENTMAIEIPESEIQDIDTEEDWIIAEMKYKILRGH